MLVLGVTGFPNGGHDGGHDASACLLDDGRLVSMCEEERFTRRKHACDTFPLWSSKKCLDDAGITLDDIDRIAFGWAVPRLHGERGAQIVDDLTRPNKSIFPTQLFPRTREPQIDFISHHEAHVASSFWSSGFDEATGIVMDGQGEFASTSVFHCSRTHGLRLLREFGPMESLGFLYQATSGFLGLGQLNAGKTMGLAAYGSDRYHFDCLKLNSDGFEFHGFPRVSIRKGEIVELYQVAPLWHEYFVSQFGLQPLNPIVRWNATRGQKVYSQTECVLNSADLAASVQKLVEEVAIHVTRLAVQLAGSPNVVLAGGVALNCPMNLKIAQMPEVKNLWIFPAPHDSGSSFGAACQSSFHAGIVPCCGRIEHCYVGPEFSSDDVTSFLKQSGVHHRRMNVTNLGTLVAERISQGQVVGVFRGRSEIGPRALGGRSILADPRSNRIRDRVNSIKGREFWRPLAPSVLEPHMGTFFEDAQHGSPFMLTALQVKASVRDEIAGVVHTDHTARVQVVSEEESSSFGDFLAAIVNNSDLPMVLNTSFNLAGEPIVGCPADALKAFYTSGLDSLVIGDCLISKHDPLRRGREFA